MMASATMNSTAPTMATDCQCRVATGSRSLLVLVSNNMRRLYILCRMAPAMYLAAETGRAVVCGAAAHRERLANTLLAAATAGQLVYSGIVGRPVFESEIALPLH